MNKDKLFGGILGLCVGDALGVPVEFYIRDELKKYPVKDMIGGGHHNQVPGTWSDDSSLVFCLMDSLCDGYDPVKVGESFCRWLYKREWTPHGRVFDIGIATKSALNRVAEGVPALEAGGRDERSNGNGSLMRILPILFYVQDMPLDERFRVVKEISSLTHRHLRSVIACQFYIEMGRYILLGHNLEDSYKGAIRDIFDYYKESAGKSELVHFKRVFFSDISQLVEKEISSDGYVVHTLEASLWCLLTTGSYEEAVLKAVNLGNDSDTTGAVTGGLAGLYYGIQSIPQSWIKALARLDDILELSNRFWERIQ